MRRASTCLAVLGLIALRSSTVAVAAEPTASITTFTAKPTPIPRYEGEGGTWPNTSNCGGCGAAVELDYEMAGEGYAPTPWPRSLAH